jgi:hypothetical protein
MKSFNDLKDKTEKEYEKGKDNLKDGLHKAGDKIEHVADDN